MVQVHFFRPEQQKARRRDGRSPGGETDCPSDHRSFLTEVGSSGMRRLSEVFKDTTVKDFKNHFLNDTEMLSVIDADGNALNDDAYVVDGCKVQLISKSDGTTILDELTIQVSEKATETDPPTTDPDNPIDPDNPNNDFNIMDFIDFIADKVGVTSNQLLMIAGGSLAGLLLLIIVISAIGRRRY